MKRNPSAIILHLDTSPSWNFYLLMLIGVSSWSQVVESCSSSCIRGQLDLFLFFFGRGCCCFCCLFFRLSNLSWIWILWRISDLGYGNCILLWCLSWGRYWFCGGKGGLQSLQIWSDFCRRKSLVLLNFFPPLIATCFFCHAERYEYTLWLIDIYRNLQVQFL